MKSAILKWPLISKSLREADLLYLFLDYDGTLTPIVDSPEKAILPSEMKGVLQELSKMPHIKVAIVSGRSLFDLKDMVGLKNLVYVGNHGYEINGKDLQLKSLITPNLRNIFEVIKQEFNNLLPEMEGAWLEDKGATLSIHYRLVKDRKVVPLRKNVARIVKRYFRNREIKIGEGKKVIEIRPPFAWDKGKAVSWILRQEQFISRGRNILPIYIGDDITDEDVFVTLYKKGITIFVGDLKRRPSRAQYYLQDTTEVADFLTRVLNLTKHEAHAG